MLNIIVVIFGFYLMFVYSISLFGKMQLYFCYKRKKNSKRSWITIVPRSQYIVYTSKVINDYPRSSQTFRSS